MCIRVPINVCAYVEVGHPACFDVYRFAASTFFLTPVFVCDAFNGPEVMK